MKIYCKRVKRLKSGKLVSWLGENYCRVEYVENKWTEPRKIAKKLGYLLCVFQYEKKVAKLLSDTGPKEELWECEIGEIKKINDWPCPSFRIKTAADMKLLSKREHCEYTWMFDSVMTNKVKLIRRIK